MAVQYGEAFAVGSSPAFRSNTEVDFLRHEIFEAETANVPKGICPAKYK